MNEPAAPLSSHPHDHAGLAGLSDQHVIVPASVLVRQLDDEAVLLNLDSEQYFGLDEVGTRMLNELTEAPTIRVAYDRLLEAYDVDPETLVTDLTALVGELAEQGLITLVEPAAG